MIGKTVYIDSANYKNISTDIINQTRADSERRPFHRFHQINDVASVVKNHKYMTYLESITIPHPSSTERTHPS